MLDHLQKKNVMIDPGVLPAGELYNVIAGSVDTIRIISIAESTLETFRGFGVSVRLLPDINLEGEVEMIHHHDLHNIYREIVNSGDMWLLMDRYKKFSSSTMTMSRILILIARTLQLLEEEKPEAIFFMATPHNIRTWVFAKVAEFLNVEVYYFQYSIFPWRTYLYKGVSIDPVVMSPNKASNIDDHLMCEHLRIKKSSVGEALPEYERKRIARNAGKYFNIKVEIARFWRRPDLILSKYICYRSYQRISEKVLPDSYVVLFLHFQPERTTVPEGGVFAQQAMAAALLIKALDNDIKLVIKEHPSTFTNICDWKQRSPEWYKTLVALGADLVDMDVDAYTLIDNAVCAVSIAGTVVGESLIRGTPAIFFGAGPLLDVSSDYLHRYNSVEELASFIRKSASDRRLGRKSEVTDLIVDQIKQKTICADVSSKTSLSEAHSHNARCSSILNYYDLIFNSRDGFVE